MHWLPLVAMVIASALPFPHNPVSSAAVPTTQPGPDRRRERPRDPTVRLAASPVDYSLRGNASQTDYSAAAAARQHSDRQNLQNQKDYAKTSTSELEKQVTNQSERRSHGEDKSAVSLGVSAEGGALGTEDHSEDSFLPKDYKADSRSRQEYLKSADLRMESFLDGDELFLDAHPRVFFSSSSSPPEHLPLPLMLESSLLEDDGEEQEDTDRHIEGHGDHAIDKSTTPSWADYSKVTSKEAVHPVKRDKRSDLTERRGDKSVCESENFWEHRDTAIDDHGETVTVLKEIKTRIGPIKQYFFETRCRVAQQSRGNSTKGAAAKPAGTGLAGGACLGVDKKQWLSECKIKQSFVRALTKDANNRIKWRWIRIDSSCVCVLLSRSSQRRGVMMNQGRG